MAEGCKEAGHGTGPVAVPMGTGGQGQPGTLHRAHPTAPADGERAGGGLQPPVLQGTLMLFEQRSSLRFKIC